MVEIHFKTFSPLAAASSWAVITAQSAPIGVVRLQVVRRGAAIRGALSARWSTCHSSRQAADSAGEWPATTAAPAKAGALTQLLSLCANRFRVVSRLLDPARRRLQGRVRHSRQVRIGRLGQTPKPFTEMTPIAQSFANGAEYHAKPDLQRGNVRRANANDRPTHQTVAVLPATPVVDNHPEKMGKYAPPFDAADLHAILGATRARCRRDKL